MISAQPPKKNGNGEGSLDPGNYKNQFNCQSSNILRERSVTGQCTSTRVSFWGQARFGQFRYGKIVDTSKAFGNNLPSARLISNTISNQNSATFNKHGLNLLFVFFAQFMDHNMAATPENNQHMDIPVPGNDLRPGRRFLPFKRSVRIKMQDSNMQRPINILTSALDLVAVYGASSLRNREVSERDGLGEQTGRLLTSGNGGRLPINRRRAFNAPDNSSRFFLAGDHRANEHPLLLALHTIFLREHNRLVRLIKTRDGGNPIGKEVYKIARAMNIAQFQKIVFEEFYPAITGKHMDPYTGFKPNVDPTISDIFSGAAFRIGHTMVSENLPRWGKSGRLNPFKLRDVFFRTADKFSEDEMETFLRGTAQTLAEEVDTKVVNLLRNGLFQNTGVTGIENGFDLVAVNIQRGRDHGLSRYNELRKLFGTKAFTKFSEISSNPQVAKQLSDAYRGRINNVEAFIGLLAENHKAGAGFGKTMYKIWKEEFHRLRDGDQFHYLREDKYPQFIKLKLGDWMAQMKKPGSLSLKDIIVRNSRILAKELPKTNIFNARGKKLPNFPKSPSTPNPKPSKSPFPCLLSDSSCRAQEDFGKLNPNVWPVFNNEALNTEAWSCYEDKRNVQQKDGHVEISIQRSKKVLDGNNYEYSCGGFESSKMFEYGCFKAKIKPFVSEK